MKKNIKNLRISGSYFMRSTSLIIMLVVIMPVVTQAQAGNVNFSGSWNINKEKSAIGEGGGQRMGGGNIMVIQDANLLSVERTRTGQDGQSFTMTMKYTLDGKESVNTSPKGESKSVAAWSADGKILTIVTTRTREENGETRILKSTEEWTLSDAKILMVKSVRQGRNGEVRSTIVYDKQ